MMGLHVVSPGCVLLIHREAVELQVASENPMSSLHFRPISEKYISIYLYPFVLNTADRISEVYLMLNLCLWALLKDHSGGFV